MKNLFFSLTAVFLFSNLHAQQIEKLIQQGNNFYKQQQYEQAEAEYRKAINIDPANKIAQFNLANAVYKKNKADEAKALYDEIANKEKEADDRSKAFYNKGVVLSAQKKLEESIEAYKYTLRLNPDDKEARENLQKALLELKKKNPPKKKEEQKKQQKEQKQPKSQSKLSQKEAEQKLKLLEQKEKEAQQRLQKEKAKGGSSQPKDW